MVIIERKSSNASFASTWPLQYFDRRGVSRMVGLSLSLRYLGYTWDTSAMKLRYFFSISGEHIQTHDVTSPLKVCCTSLHSLLVMCRSQEFSTVRDNLRDNYLHRFSRDSMRASVLLLFFSPPKRAYRAQSRDFPIIASLV